MEITETKSLHSLIVGIGSMSSLTFCSKWILGHKTHRSLYPSVKGCLSVTFPACSVCRKLEVYQHLPIEDPQYDISSEGEGRPDEVQNEVAPSDNSNDGA